MEEQVDQIRPSAYVGIAGQEAETPIMSQRRAELIRLAEDCCRLFDAAKVKGREKCYVGRLCQAMMEFSV